ncbi:porin, partial [Bradyrhizobium australiense]|uniref:porin n=1 Tax=Bradyrhizobium australiense TaxID=2721161 RepID=UPI0014913549
LGGYLRAETTFGTSYHFDAANSGVGGARNRLSDYYSSRSRLGLSIDTRTATEYGLVRTYFDGAWTWTTGTYSGTGAGGTAYTTSLGSQVATGTPGLYNAEALIQQAMERLMKGRTSIVIAHRLSTVRSLDRILVFDRGEIVEQGTHAALIARPGGVHRGLFERQAIQFSQISAAGQTKAWLAASPQP